MNKLIAVGRIGRDAETRYTQSGTAVASFPVAVDVGYGDNKTTQWYNCALFGKRAEGGLIQYLTKGAQVVIEGSPKLNQYTTKDGEAKANIEVNIDDVTLVGGRADPQQMQQHAAQQAAPAPVDNGFDQDVPF
jgi:single-strand DNA-binding protein